MSDIQRPSKQGGATTYQGKVAAGYTKILASEMDADLDLIYAAWNGGVDTVNIADGSITDVKIADVSWSKIVGGAVQNGIIPLVPRGSVNAGATYFEYHCNHPDTPSYDASKPSFMVRCDYTTDDAFEIWHAPPPGTTWTRLFAVFGNGLVDAALLAGAVGRAQLAVNAVNGANAVVASPTAFVLSTPNVWTTVATLPSITTRGGWVHLHANHCLSVTGPSGGGKCNQRWVRDGAHVTAWSYFVSTSTAYVPFPGISYVDQPVAAGAHVYAYQVLVDTGCIITSTPFGDGLFQAVEIG